jgi:hypothetical protein
MTTNTNINTKIDSEMAALECQILELQLARARRHKLKLQIELKEALQVTNPDPTATYTIPATAFSFQPSPENVKRITNIAWVNQFLTHFDREVDETNNGATIEYQLDVEGRPAITQEEYNRYFRGCK